MGLETEYALTAIRPSLQESLDRSEVLNAVFRLARREPHLPAMHHKCGCFFENGSLLYLDTGGHVEYSTPECTTPQEVILHQVAGESLLFAISEELTTLDRKFSEIAFFKCNVDYSGSGATWGCHESYLHKDDPGVLPAQLIPFLVSRIIFTGAGGLNPLAHGIEFLLSPRVEFLVKVISSASTRERGVFHTKDEPLCRGGFHRLHLICGESNCSETATLLKVGATALIVAMIEAGLKPGNAVKLRSPLEAMRTFSRDPGCKKTVEGVNGRKLTALDIQNHYLAQAEALLGNSFMPSWAEEVTQRWRSTLDRLERGAPDSVITTLDWALKLAIFKDRVHRKGLLWDEIAHPGDKPSNGLNPAQDRHAAHRINSLRHELREIDMRFGQVGARGIFAVLEKAGCLDQGIVEPALIKKALKSPPRTSRARLRGKCVKRFAERRHSALCDWDKVFDLDNRRILDLSNPLEQKEHWKELPEVGEDF